MRFGRFLKTLFSGRDGLPYSVRLVALVLVAANVFVGASAVYVLAATVERGGSAQAASSGPFVDYVGVDAGEDRTQALARWVETNPGSVVESVTPVIHDGRLIGHEVRYHR